MKNIFQKNYVLLIISLIASILLWVYTVGNLNPNIEKKFYNISVEVDETKGPMSSLGLTVIDRDEYVLKSVTIGGNRNDLASLTQDKISAKLDLSTIVNPGNVTLDVIINISGGESLTVIDKELPEPFRTAKKITIFIDKMLTWDVELDPKKDITINGLVLPEDYFVNTYEIFPKSIEIKGPATIINQIANVTAAADIINPDKLNTQTLSGEICLYDNKGIKIENKYIEMSTDTIQITVPVYKEKTVPFIVSFVNTMGNDIPEVEYTLSPDRIKLAGIPDEIDELDVYSVGVIDVAGMTELFVKDFNVKSEIYIGKERFINRTNIDKVVLTIRNPLYELRTCEFNIQLYNYPLNSTVKLLTPKISYTLVGHAENIENALKGNITVYADMENIDRENGIYDIPLHIDLGTYDNLINIIDNDVQKMIQVEYLEGIASDIDGAEND